MAGFSWADLLRNGLEKHIAHLERHYGAATAADAPVRAGGVDARSPATEEASMNRTRTYSWEDPKVFADPARQLSGLEFLNQIGSVHGGMLAGLADSALGCTVHSKLPAGTGYTSLDLTIKFTRPANLDSGVLRCRGEVVTMGRRTATAEARIVDGRGKVVAHAIATCLLFPL